MSLHDKIMSLQANCDPSDWASTREAYSYGHIDARHAAAELASEADALIAELAILLGKIQAADDQCRPAKGLIDRAIQIAQEYTE